MTDSQDQELLPVRMLNEYAYCPRLFHLMHVEGRWADNVYTEEGRDVHRRVDRLDHVLPDPDATATAGAASGRRGRGRKQPPRDDGDERPTISRSVKLGSDSLQLIAKLDLVSTDGDEAVPVETKRGRVPDTPERSWEPERVQLMAQGLLLRENGYRSDHGVLYFAGSRTRVDVPFTTDLEAKTRELIAEAKRATRRTDMPAPLEDSPKCPGCSLNGICLPDETLALQALEKPEAVRGPENRSGDETDTRSEVRRLYPPRENALPFYVQEQGAKIGKRKSELVVRKQGEEIAKVRLKDVSQVVLLGNVQISTQTLHLLCEAGVPVVLFSTGHWFYGIATGITLRNAYNREAQFRASADPIRRIEFARSVVQAKAANQRTVLRRNVSPTPADVVARMAALIRKVPHATEAELLGLEGGIAAHYFGNFGRALKPRDFDAEWDFEKRNRRPPRDPINALLSFGYAILAKECAVALLAEGLDPWWGLYHRPRHGRPALALDLMEEFRPLVVDSAVLTAVNTGMVTRRSFRRSRAECMLTPDGRKGFLRAYESRMDHLVTHPLFGYRCSWRSIIRVQARLLAGWLRGDVPEYTPMRTR